MINLTTTIAVHSANYYVISIDKQLCACFVLAAMWFHVYMPGVASLASVKTTQLDWTALGYRINAEA